MKLAIELVKANNFAAAAIQNIEKDYYANSSRSAKEAKRKAVKDLLAAAHMASYPLDPKKIKLIAGVLREAGYKSADTYLVEAKTAHIEEGWPWTALLDRHFKLCRKAVKRGQGPQKKAPEVERDLWTSLGLLDVNVPGTKVPLSPQLFAFGVLFMMREIELAALTTKDVKLDQAGHGDMEGIQNGPGRQLHFQNAAVHMHDCPYAVAEVLLNSTILKGAHGGHFTVDETGKPTTKSDLVKDWVELFGMKVTGHSTRRSGALQYIRQGWAVPHVGYLGRWKSNVILQYAEEALETIAANTPGRFGKPPDAPNVEKVQPLSTVLKPDPDTGPKIDNEAIIAQIKADISKLKNGTKVLTKDFNDVVEDLKSKMESAQKFLPKYVISHLPPISSDAHQQPDLAVRPGSSMEDNLRVALLQLHLSICGDGAAVNCTKCNGIAQCKEVEKGSS